MAYVDPELIGLIVNEIRQSGKRIEYVYKDVFPLYDKTYKMPTSIREHRTKYNSYENKIIVGIAICSIISAITLHSYFYISVLLLSLTIILILALSLVSRKGRKTYPIIEFSELQEVKLIDRTKKRLQLTQDLSEQVKLISRGQRKYIYHDKNYYKVPSQYLVANKILGFTFIILLIMTTFYIVNERINLKKKRNCN